MTPRSNNALIAALLFAGPLAASPLAASGARAQEAIMLETIGAVRMVRPDEVARGNDVTVLARQRPALPARTTPERHAVVAD